MFRRYVSRNAWWRHSWAQALANGTADKLVPIAGGRDAAPNIKGAKRVEIDGMGHDLPLAFVDRIADAVAAVAQRAKAAD